MKKRWLALAAALTTALILNAASPAARSGDTHVSFTNRISLARPQPQEGPATRKRAAFAKARRLLELRGVPFDADALLAPDWRVALDAPLRQMPEMSRQVRQRGPLNGVVLADTLHLSAATDVSSDSVVIVRRLEFDSRHPVIRVGPHAAYVFVTESVEFPSTGTERPSVRIDARGLGKTPTCTQLRTRRTVIQACTECALGPSTTSESDEIEGCRFVLPPVRFRHGRSHSVTTLVVRAKTAIGFGESGCSAVAMARREQANHAQEGPTYEIGTMESWVERGRNGWDRLGRGRGLPGELHFEIYDNYGGMYVNHAQAVLAPGEATVAKAGTAEPEGAAATEATGTLARGQPMVATVATAVVVVLAETAGMAEMVELAETAAEYG